MVNSVSKLPDKAKARGQNLKEKRLSALPLLRRKAIVTNGDNMKWLGFGATNLSHATKLTGSKLAKKSDNTQLFYIMC